MANTSERMTQEQYEYHKTHNLLAPSGRVDQYKMAKHLGLVGSSREYTWNKIVKAHECCGSSTRWRHLKKCKVANNDVKI